MEFQVTRSSCSHSSRWMTTVTAWLRTGPEQAKVEDVQTTVEEVKEDKYGGVFEKRKSKR